MKLIEYVMKIAWSYRWMSRRQKNSSHMNGTLSGISAQEYL